MNYCGSHAFTKRLKYCIKVEGKLFLIRNRGREMSGREYRWYLEPLDAHSNKVFSENLDEGFSLTEFKKKEKKCPIRAWEVSHSWVTFFQKSRVGSGLDFRIWVSEGNSEPRLWTFSEKKIKASKSVAEAVREMNRIH